MKFNVVSYVPCCRQFVLVIMDGLARLVLVFKTNWKIEANQSDLVLVN